MYGALSHGPLGRMMGPAVAAGAIPALAGANWLWIAVSAVSAVSVLAALSTLVPWRRKMI
jgi:hypothetical protein